MLFTVIKRGDDPHTAESLAAFAGDGPARAAMMAWLDGMLEEEADGAPDTMPDGLDELLPEDADDA